MAHPSRKEFIPYLQEILGDVPIAWEKGEGRWDTGIRAWKLYDKKADIHFVIQDDAILCKNFKEKVSEFVYKFGSKYAYQLYFAEKFKDIKKVQKFKTGIKKGYMVLRGMPHGISIGLSTYIINDMIIFCEKLNDIPQYDMKIRKFLLNKNINVIFPIPSLVDHKDCESTIGNRSGRVAHYFVDNKFNSKILKL